MNTKKRHTRGLVVVIAMEMAATSVSERPLERSVSSEQQGKEGHVPEIPNFDRPILTAGHQPLAFAVEAHGCDISVVAFKNRNLQICISGK